MNIIIGENSNLNQGSSGLITGEIYFEENNNYFPEKGWNDFTVIILGWWISSFLKSVKQIHSHQQLEHIFYLKFFYSFMLKLCIF